MLVVVCLIGKSVWLSPAADAIERPSACSSGYLHQQEHMLTRTLIIKTAQVRVRAVVCFGEPFAIRVLCETLERRDRKT